MVEAIDNLVAKLKEVYFSWEDRYYDFLDSLEERGLPVYKVIDPVDKVVPSFAVVLLIGFLVLVGLLSVLVGMLLPAGEFRVSVVDDTGSGIPDVTVKARIAEKEMEATTDNLGDAKVKAAKGDKVELVAEKEGYQTKREEVVVSEDVFKAGVILTMLGQQVGATTRTIRLLDKLGQPVLETVTLSFSCANPYATAPEDITVSNGEATVSVPADCGKLSANVNDSARFKDIQSYELGEGLQTIYLEAEEEAQGTINVDVRSKGKPLDGIKLELYKYIELELNPNAGPIDATFTSGGQGKFEVVPGSYVVKTYDSSGQYGEEQSRKTEVGANETETVSFDLKENVIGNVTVKAVDKLTKAGIADAEVTLYYESDNEPLTTLKTDASGTAVFPVSKNVGYRASVYASDYAQAKKAGLRNNTVTTVEMEKCTPVNCGLLIVKVEDQDGASIENATVALYDDDTKFLAGLSNQTSDINGMAEFSNVKTGNYFAFAFKGGFSGRSEPTKFVGKLATDNTIDLKVVMKVENGIMRGVAIDRESRPVSFATVTVFNSRDNTELGKDFTDGNGVFELSTKADKRVYIRFEKEGYSDYYTVAKAIMPNATTTFLAQMEPEILEEEVKIKFLGMFVGEQEATTLAAGQDYIARWILRVPKLGTFSETGLHIRTGNDALMEKDHLFIKEVNVPNAGIIKAKMYDEDSGLDAQQYQLTASDAKWAQAAWTNPLPGVYEAEAIIHVTPQAKVNEELSVNYRAWGIKQGARQRDPKDDLIESFELYDNSYKQVFQVGVTTLCNPDFCWNASITDLEEDLIESVLDQYQAKIFNEYELRFSLVNNSPFRIHNNADFRITNPEESILFTNYTLFDAESQPTAGVLNKHEFPRLDVGTLGQKQSVTGSIKFIPQRAVSGIIHLRLVSDQQIVFEKRINVLTSAPKELDVQLGRTVFPSGLQQDLNVSVKDKATGEPIKDAIVRLKAGPVGRIVIQAVTTGPSGVVVLRMPGQKPGAKLFVEVEKIDYQVKTIELRIESKVLEADPQQIGVALNSTAKTEASDEFRLKNVTRFPLTISRMDLVGNFENLLDNDQIANWLNGNYVGQVIKENETNKFVLKTFLSEDGKRITERKDFDSQLLVEVTNFGQKWQTTIPVRVSIGLGPEVDDPNCLILTRNKWEAATQGNPVSVEFQIQNNCSIEGKPIALRNLAARLQLKGNQLGEYSLAIGSTKIDLRSFYFRNLKMELPAEDSLSAVLTFTPYAGVSGVAETDVIIQAGNPQEGKDQLLVSTIATSIAAVNLKDCISFSRHLIMMREGEAGSFDIKTAGCGGPVEFEIESPLTLSQKQFALKGDDAASIEVFSERSVPGQYPILVKGRGPNQKQVETIKNIKARVLTDPKSCIDVTRFEYDIFVDARDPLSGRDSGTLINNCPDKQVKVTIVEPKDLGAIIKKALMLGGVIALSGMIAEELSGVFEKRPDSQIGTYTKKECPGIGSAVGRIFTLGLWRSRCWVDADGKEVTDQATIDMLDGKMKESISGDEADVASVQELKTAIGKGSYPQTGKRADIFAAYQQSGYRTSMTVGKEGEGILSAQKPDGSGVSYTINKDGSVTYVGEVTQAQIQEAIKRGMQIPPLPGPDIAPPTAGGGGAATSGMPAEILSGGNFTTIENYLTVNGWTKAERAPDSAGVKIVRFEKKGSNFIYSVKNNIANPPTDRPLVMPDVTLVSAPRTGYAVLPVLQAPTAGKSQTGGAMANLFGQMLGAQGGGLLGAGLGGLGGIEQMILGSGTPIQKGMTAALLYGLKEWFFSEDKKQEFTIVKQDLNVSSPKLVRGVVGETEQEETDIEVELGSEKFRRPHSEKGGLTVEEQEIVFENKTGFVTERERPRYDILIVDGTRHNYNETKEYEDFDELEETESTKEGKRFRLEFNAIPPDVNVVGPTALLNCQVGTKTGSTGKKALPKVKFDWEWSQVPEEFCDVANANGVFCDATQFSEALLQKINALATSIEGRASQIKCPTALDKISTKTNEIPEFDIGLQKMFIQRTSTTDVNVIVEIANTNPIALPATVSMVARRADSNATAIDCPEGNRTTSVLSLEKLGCNFTNLAAGLYVVDANMTSDLSSCPEDCDDQIVSNRISTTFAVGSTGLEECEPFSTSRLEDFYAASGFTDPASQQDLSRVKFKALLIRDRFSPDFLHDADEYWLSKAFAVTPAFYKPSATTPGLSRYFRDPKAFVFKPKFGEAPAEGYLLPGPGIYDVRVNITYKNNSWRLFDGNNLNAKIEIELDKAQQPDPDSPFYWLPFDGVIGLEDGRVGYGLNFRGDPVTINDDPISLQTITIPGSTSVPNGLLEMIDDSDNFKRMNTDDRGVMLRVIRSDNPKVIFSPSLATPLMLRIGNQKGEAWAFYSVGINGSAVQTGPSISRWNGIGYSCRSFDDKAMVDEFFETPDMHGLGTDCALLGGDIAPTTYGFEFCEPVNFGNVFVKSIFFTPQTGNNQVQIMASNDNSDLTTPSTGASQLVQLDGTTLSGLVVTPALQYNDPNNKMLNIEKMFKAVEDGFACVSGSDAVAEIWWNPKPVFDAIAAQETAAEGQCITAAAPLR